MNIQVTIEAENRVVSTDLLRLIEVLDNMRGLKGVSAMNISVIATNISSRVPNHLGLCDEVCPINILELQEEYINENE